MPSFDFDAEYGGGDEGEASEPTTATPAVEVADLIVANLVQQQPEEELDEDYMNEVDKRLEVTTYYRELLRASLFDNNSEAARIVEGEIRRFVRNRVEVLLGIRKDGEPRVPPPPPLPFSEPEITALKVLAARLIANPSIAKPQPEPTVRRATAPAPKPSSPLRRAQKPAPGTPPSPPSAPPAPAGPAKEAPKEPPKKRGGRPPVSMKKRIINPETGKEVEITVPRIQRPAGALPFPSAAEMEAITAQQASSSVVTSAAGKAGTTELVKAAISNPET